MFDKREESVRESERERKESERSGRATRSRSDFKTVFERERDFKKKEKIHTRARGEKKKKKIITKKKKKKKGKKKKEREKKKLTRSYTRSHLHKYTLFNRVYNRE